MSYSEHDEITASFSKLAGKFAVVFLYLSKILSFPKVTFQHPVQHRFRVFLGTCTVTDIRELNTVLKHLVL
jgi:hypothetical protein